MAKPTGHILPAAGAAAMQHPPRDEKRREGKTKYCRAPHLPPPPSASPAVRRGAAAATAVHPAAAWLEHADLGTGALDQPTWAADLVPPDPAADEARRLRQPSPLCQERRRRSRGKLNTARHPPPSRLLVHCAIASRPAAATTPTVELALGFCVFETCRAGVRMSAPE
jgi:hypothetical protein